MDTLDRITHGHGGRVYLAKDACCRAARVREGYPRRAAFDTIRAEAAGMPPQVRLGALSAARPVTRDIGLALVIGATSDIGRAIARRLAAEGWALQLAGRDPARIGAEAADLRVRTGAGVSEHCCDVLVADGGAALVNGLEPCPDVAVCVVGSLGDQHEERAGSLGGRTGHADQLQRSGPAAGRARPPVRDPRQRRAGGRQLGRRRPRPRHELRLRLGQGRVHHVPVRPAQPAGGIRRSRRYRQTWLRAHTDDRGHGPAARTDCHAGGGRGRRWSTRSGAGETSSTCVACGARSCWRFRALPERVFKRLRI